MNIVMINNSWIPSGGASIVASGLVHELRRRGHQVRLWSSRGDGGSKALNCRGTTRLAQMLIRLGLHRDQAQALSYGLPFHPDVAWADVIHCHNLHKGYFSLPVLRLLSDRKPIVWTLHDFDAVWGGCDVPMGCDKWRNGCLPCPQRQSSHLSGPGSSPPRGLHLRRKVRQSSRVTYVPVSHWMERELLKDPAMRSAQLHTVPNGVDVELFHPRAKRTREELGLPVGRPLVACLASNPKAYWIAFDLAFEAFRMLAEQEQIIPILVGRHSQELLSRCELPCPAIALGAVSDRCKLAAVYCAVDTVVVPSCAEAFGLIASEAMACGTPVATFAGTAVAEQIIDGETGCLAPEFSASDLADAIRRTLALKQSLPDLAQRCRTHVESNYSLELSVARYEALYNELVS